MRQDVDVDVHGATRRDLRASALVLGVAAAAWFGWARAQPPQGWSSWLAAGSMLGGVLAVVAGVLTWQARRGDSAMADPRGRSFYNRVVLVEVAAIMLGAVVLRLLGLSDYLSPWILFVVGVHFVPLGRLFHDGGLRVLGVLLVPVAAIGVVSGIAGWAAASAVAGGLAGLSMLVAGADSLRRSAAAAG